MRRRFARSAEVTSLGAILRKSEINHLSHTIAPLLRFSLAGTYPELQFENQTEHLALAYLTADTGEIEKSVHASPNISPFCQPTSLKFVRISLLLAAAQS